MHVIDCLFLSNISFTVGYCQGEDKEKKKKSTQVNMYIRIIITRSEKRKKECFFPFFLLISRSCSTIERLVRDYLFQCRANLISSICNYLSSQNVHGNKKQNWIRSSVCMFRSVCLSCLDNLSFFSAKNFSHFSVSFVSRSERHSLIHERNMPSSIALV